ncbi:sulfite exporter TauE/SafE family protein [Marinobacteraceae bacterium S3BR75-40.1]
MDILLYILAGAGVGLAVGLTGVGGGSLMTPLLLLFGFPTHIAIGTDLMYAAITKASGVYAHHRQGTVDWKVVSRLAAGSIPASIGTVIVLSFFFTHPEEYKTLLLSTLGVMLMLTSTVLILRQRLQRYHRESATHPAPHRYQTSLTVIAGFFLGACVTLSSVGAGAFGAAILLILYPALSSVRVIGSDLAHAVPLTLIAGLGHVHLGNVDFMLLGSLLIGSIPAIHLGTRLAKRVPDRVLQSGLASILLVIGVKYAFF